MIFTMSLFFQHVPTISHSHVHIKANTNNKFDRNESLDMKRGQGGGIRAITSVRQIGQLTGQPSMNNTGQVNVYGTDLGSMFSHTDGRIYFLFGDTFGPPGPPGSGDWRSNTMACTTDSVAADGITFDGWITDPLGHAKALVEGDHDPNDGSGEVTKIPTAGWSFEGRQFLWFMSVKQWGAPGEWEVNYSEIAYSDDNGNSWFLSGTRWPGNSNFIQVAVAEQSGYLLFWGVPAGRFGGVKLARVLPGDVLDETAYQYYTGTGWDAEEEDGTLIVNPPVGELSVLWNSYLQRWIMMYLNESTASIEVREAHQPTGPWSEPWQVASATDYPALYGAFLHHRYIENEGQTVYFLMSQFGQYNVFLMKVVFMRNETGVVEESLSEELPESYTLHQNIPNPFNASTKIQYHIPKDCMVTLRVFNTLGQQVRRLISGHQEAGQYSIFWDGRGEGGGDLSSGLYFCRLNADGHVRTIKMILLE
jgi:hypothetical protein